MTISFVNACVFNANSSGNGDFTVSSIVDGWLTPSDAGVVDGGTYRYRAALLDGSQWEIGTGIYTSANATLSRSNVSIMHYSGSTFKYTGTPLSPVNFTSPPQVALTIFAEDIIGADNFTTFGRSLVDDADAATARATLGVAAAPTSTDNAIARFNGTGGEVQDSTALISDGGGVIITVDQTIDDTLTLSGNNTGNASTWKIGPGAGGGNLTGLGFYSQTGTTQVLRLDTNGSTTLAGATTIGNGSTVAGQGDTVVTIRDADSTNLAVIDETSGVELTFGAYSSAHISGGAGVIGTFNDHDFLIRRNNLTKITIGTSAIVVAEPIQVGTIAAQSDAYLSARGRPNAFEFGHINAVGYGSTIGFMSNAGTPYIAFHAEAGTTANTFKTRGLLGSIFLADDAGGFAWKTLASASADNQTATNLATLDNAGNLSAVGTIKTNKGFLVQGSTSSLFVMYSGSMVTNYGAIVKYDGSASIGYIGGDGGAAVGGGTGDAMAVAGVNALKLAGASSASTLTLGANGIDFTGHFGAPNDQFVYSYAGSSIGQIRAGFHLQGAATSVLVYTNGSNIATFNTSGLTLNGALTGGPVPANSTLPVGCWTAARNNTTTVNDGALIAGSNMTLLAYPGVGGTLPGTWRNVFGIAIANGGTGLFVRVA